jgi:hypothetical protein
MCVSTVLSCTMCVKNATIWGQAITIPRVLEGITTLGTMCVVVVVVVCCLLFCLLFVVLFVVCCVLFGLFPSKFANRIVHRYF